MNLRGKWLSRETAKVKKKPKKTGKVAACGLKDARNIGHCGQWASEYALGHKTAENKDHTAAEIYSPNKGIM